MAQRDRQHFVGRRHFQIERQRQFIHQARDIGIGNMPAIFAEVCGNAVRAGGFGLLGGFHRVRVDAAARIADGGHVVDVDAKA